MHTESPSTTTADDGVAAARAWRWRLRLWHEIVIIGVFYMVYSAVRNEFGSKAVDPHVALRNAERVIRVEEAMSLFREDQLQDLFLDWDWFIWWWNVFYGTFHFGVTIGALVWVFWRYPTLYPRLRTTLASTTALALVGFSLFPLMPPRLLNAGPPYGGEAAHDYGFVDTLRDVGGLWSFDSGTLEELSNQYAAMPSLHVGWAVWCTLVFYPRVRSRWARVAAVAYPLATMFAIMVTGNHYWIDGVGGVATLGVGYLIGRRLGAFEVRVRSGGRIPAVDRAGPGER